jgi:hypothetical protein
MMICKDPRRSKARTAPARLGPWLAGLLVLSLVVTACEMETPGAGVQNSPLAVDSPLPGAAIQAPLATTVMPTPTAAAAVLPPTPIQLVVLHTNDNWGETEPCG